MRVETFMLLRHYDAFFPDHLRSWPQPGPLGVWQPEIRSNLVPIPSPSHVLSYKDKSDIKVVLHVFKKLEMKG